MNANVLDQSSPVQSPSIYSSPIRNNENALWMSTGAAVTAHGSVPLPGDKPKRPLSAYNFFFQLERDRIINKGDDDGDDIDVPFTYTKHDVARMAQFQKEKAEAMLSGSDSAMQQNQKRSHRKTHGKIGFGDLARTIAARWKSLTPVQRSVFDESALQEKVRYKTQLQVWNQQHKAWKDAIATMQQQPMSTMPPSPPPPFSASSPTTIISSTSFQPQQQQQHQSATFSNEYPMMVTPPQQPKPTIQQYQQRFLAAPHMGQSFSWQHRQQQHARRMRMRQLRFQQQQQQQQQHMGPPIHSVASSDLSGFYDPESADGDYSMENNQAAFHPDDGMMRMMVPFFDDNCFDECDNNTRSMLYSDFVNDQKEDYERTSQETYQRAQMMLTQQRQRQQQSNPQQRRRAMLQQRQIHLLRLMRQNQQMAAALEHQHSGIDEMYQDAGGSYEEEISTMERRQIFGYKNGENFFETEGREEAVLIPCSADEGINNGNCSQVSPLIMQGRSGDGSDSDFDHDDNTDTASEPLSPENPYHILNIVPDCGHNDEDHVGTFV